MLVRNRSVIPENLAAGRLKFLGGAMLLVGLLLVGRSFQIQVVQGDDYSKRAARQSSERVIVPAVRGRILDSKNQLLVGNLGQKESGTRLQRMPVEELAREVLGFVGRDGHGLAGLEYLFDQELHGNDGWEYRRLDAKRRRYAGMIAGGLRPTPGFDLVLTLDADVQAIVERALDRGIQKTGARSGCAVVVEPGTGNILAMATRRSTADRNVWKNDPVTKVYEPGSTFKMVTAAAALEEGKLKPTDLLDGKGGKFEIFGDVIRDTKVHGILTFTDALAVSSNVAFAQIAQKVGPKDFFRYVRSFGFGMVTGVGLPGEEKGLLKPVNQWSGRTLVTMAMGHELLATPLQLAMAFAALANDGVLMKPRIVRELRNPVSGEVVRSLKPQVVRRVMSASTAAVLRDMLRQVVQRGTARNLGSEVLDFAGKTGTAEKFDLVTKHYLKNSLNSSFAGFVPADSPEYAVIVLMDEPKIFTSGAKTAGPVFSEILHRIYQSPKIQIASLEVHASKRRLSTGWKKINESNSKQLSKKRENRLKMPDLVGLPLKSALSSIEERGLNGRYRGRGFVLSQEPPAGSRVEAGSNCSLVLGESS